MGHKVGKLIVFEGLDKSGKTTQSKFLYNHFNSISNGNVHLLSFPDYSTRIGHEIKFFLHGKSTYNNQVKHLLLSANRWEKKNEIEENLGKGHIVIINRYYYSNLAYGKANGLEYEWLLNIEKGLPREDIVILLDINPEVAIKRGKDNNFKMDNFEINKNFLLKVRKNYLDMARKNNWIIIDSDTFQEAITKKIIDKVEEYIKD